MSGNPTEINPKYPALISLGDFRFDPGNEVLFTSDGQPVALRHQSALVLRELARLPGETVLKDSLVSAVWGRTFVTDDSLVQCIKDIRKAINDTDRKIVQTVAKRGYRLEIGQPARTTSLAPSILVERIHCADRSSQARDFAEDFHDRLVLVLAPRSGVRVFSGASGATSADYLVQGRVRVSGDRVKFFLSLSEVTSRGHFHARSFTCALSQSHQLAEDVARQISSVLRISVITHNGERYATVPDDQLDLQQLFAKAHYFYSRITAADTLIGRATMQVAVQMAPDNPKALALLAHATTQMYPLIRNEIGKRETDWAMSLADRAVAQGASSSFAFRTRANLRLWLLGDHGGCRADCARALAINPNLYLTHLTLATSEILTGEHVAGIERMKAYVCLTAIDHQYPYFQSLTGLAWLLAGNVDAAIRFARDAHERSPKSAWCALVYAAAASGDAALAGTAAFRDMIERLDLPLGHFRSLPFTNLDDVDMLEARLRAAGVAQARPYPT